MSANRLANDLNEVVERAEDALRSLVDAHVLVTGGTGYVGTWFVEAMLWARMRLRGIGRVTVVSRNPTLFLNRNPHLADNDALRFVRSDIRSLDLSNVPTPQFVMHAATEASATLNSNSPDEMLSVIVEGQNRLFGELARFPRPRLLFTSSGSVYGPQPPDVSHFSEDYPIPSSAHGKRSAYQEGKRAAEQICLHTTSAGTADVVLARMFAFVGPHLPLDAHFAVGNFIRDAMQGGPIVIDGDGTTVRSYQYATDMTVWLLTMLVNGTTGRTYNVGSEQAMNMREIAEVIAVVAGPGVTYEIHGTFAPGQAIDRYVPSVVRAVTELNLSNLVESSDAIRRTIMWHHT